MFNKLVLWLVILVTIATNASSQTQEQPGTVRVTVYVEGTQTPIPTVYVSMMPCADDCRRDKSATQDADLLEYLRELAKARGIVDSPDGVIGFTNPAGEIFFQKVKFRAYQVTARKAPYQTASVVLAFNSDNATRDKVLYLKESASR
jgi:hypothetical protein